MCLLYTCNSLMCPGKPNERPVSVEGSVRPDEDRRYNHEMHMDTDVKY